MNEWNQKWLTSCLAFLLIAKRTKDGEKRRTRDVELHHPVLFLSLTIRTHFLCSTLFSSIVIAPRAGKKWFLSDVKCGFCHHLWASRIKPCRWPISKSRKTKKHLINCERARSEISHDAPSTAQYYNNGLIYQSVANGRTRQRYTKGTNEIFYTFKSEQHV